MKKVTTTLPPKTARTSSSAKANKGAATSKTAKATPVKVSAGVDDDDADAFEVTAKRDRQAPPSQSGTGNASSKSSPMHARIARELPGASIPGADRELLGTYRFDEAAHKKLMA